MPLQRLSTQAVSRANRRITMTAARQSEASWLLTFPSGNHYPVPTADLQTLGTFVISNPYPTPLAAYPALIPVPLLRERPQDTDELQVIVSLFHFIHILNPERLDNVNEARMRLCGHPFLDLLPRQNLLIVPSNGLQGRLAETAAQLGGLPFIEWGILYEFGLTDSHGAAATLYYRPYNTPIVPAWRTRDPRVEDLFAALRNDYMTLR